MYNKLFTKILDSSIWLEDTPTRIVWLTFLACMDEQGYVQFASVANVAHRARVTVQEAEEALSAFEGPDPNSSDPDNNGRRVERVPGGWLVLNAEKHRKMVTRAIIQEQTRERVRRHRAKKRTCNANVTPSEADTEARSISEATKDVSSATSAEPPVLTFSTVGKPPAWHLPQSQIDAWAEVYPDTDILGECKRAKAWLEANKRKTAKGMPRFLVSWLNRSADRPKQQANQPAKSRLDRALEAL